MTWAPGSFQIASPGGAHKTGGYVYRGLGLHMVIKASPKGRRPPTWRLTHLGSGHAIASIVGTTARTFPIASEIAECGDWSFEGLEGWKNVEPDLPQKLVDIAERHKKYCKVRAGGGGNAEIARSIAMARSA